MRGAWDYEEFAAYLDGRMRLEKLRNDAELSRVSGVKQTQISNWRRGLARPSLDSLDKIAAALKVPSSVLYERAGYLAERDPAELDLRDLPDEFALLIEAYRDPRFTDDDRALLRQSIRLFVAGFLAGVKDRETNAPPAKRQRRGQPAA